MRRRKFIKSTAVSAALGNVSAKAWAVPHGENYQLNKNAAPNDILAACPYCGVGCGTIIKTKNGRITHIVPDKDHPTNRGLQCIKGLTSAEAIYVNRLT